MGIETNGIRNMGKPDDKTALLTDGMTGIGYSTAEAFLAEGAGLAIACQTPDG